MRSIKLDINDAILKKLATEQLATFFNITDDSYDAVITDHPTILNASSFLFLNCDAPSKKAPMRVLSLPIKLGQMIDDILYLTSPRARLEHDLTLELHIQNYVLDTATGVLRDDENNRELRLTDKERLLFIALFNAPNQTLDRATLLNDVWGYVDSVETHTLETHVYRLRQKLESEFNARDIIKTHDGTYSLNI